jgi:hypothetical protein
VDRLSDVALSVLEMLVSQEFLTGLGAGLACAAIAWLVDLLTRRRHDAFGPGLAAIAAASWLFMNGRAPLGIVVMIPMFAIIGATGVLEGRPWFRGGVAVLGAGILALGAEGSIGFRLVLFLAVASVVFSVSAAEEALDTRVPTAVLLAASMGALVVGIPEVNRALVVAGSLVPFAILPVTRRRLGRAGALAYPALFAWVALADAATAHGAALGVFASLGILATGFLAGRLAERASRTGYLVLGQLAWALFASRVAGVRREIEATLVILTIGAVVALWLIYRDGRSLRSGVSLESTRPDR